VIRYRQRGHLERLRGIDQSVYAACAVKQAVFGVIVKMYET
jgi:hypothetical protein